MHELPLILFTLLVQLCVGGFLVTGLITLLARGRYSSRVVDRVADPALYALGPAMVLGLLASLFHMGTPMNSLNAFRHLSSSWLSREVFLGSLFAAFGFAFAVFQWRQWGSRALRAGLAVVTALIGVAVIYSMCRLYMLPTVPTWNHWTTPATFVLSAALLGSLAVGAAFAGVRALGTPTHLLFRGREELTPDEAADVDRLVVTVIRWVGVAAIVFAALQLLVMIFAAQPRDVPGYTSPAVSMAGLAIRGALLIVGAVLLGVFLYSRATLAAKASSLFWTVVAALVLVGVAEFLGRIMFYDSLVRVGV